MLSQVKDPYFNSYDSFRDMLSNPTTGLLTAALNSRTEAKKALTTFKTNADTLALEYQNRRVASDRHLFTLVGAHRCNLAGTDCRGQCPSTTECYATPETNVGSAVNLQMTSISVANNRIEQSLTRMENLHQQIEIEIDRRGKAKGIEHAISLVMLDYGNQQAHLTEAIAAERVKAAKARKKAGIAGGLLGAIKGGIVAAATGNVSGVIDGVFNMATSAYVGNAEMKMEKRVGDLQAQKERLAADERATINDSNSLILDIDSAAQIKTWWLQASTLALEIDESELLVEQEMARLKAIVDEIQATERQMDQENGFLASRYFADPIHRVRMINEQIHADADFKEAQKWLFFTARALEYKWNQTFSYYDSAYKKTWSVDDVFSARNAEELNLVLTAMGDYERPLRVSQTTTPVVTDWLSLRENIFGYRDTLNGVPQQYPDPQTGLMVDARTAFRSRLRNAMDAGGIIALNFSTVLQLPGGMFFLGPVYDSTGTLRSAGTYLDKIESVMVNVPGAHSGVEPRVRGELSYGGVSFVRDQTPGVALAPNHVIGEMTPYPTRYWYFDSQSVSWKYREAMSVPISLLKQTTPKFDTVGQEITAFQERSVAATDWTLTIFSIDGGVQLLNVDEVDDIEIRFKHKATNRP